MPDAGADTFVIVGGTASMKIFLEVGGIKFNTAGLPAMSMICALFNVIAVDNFMPSLSASPFWIIYLNTRLSESAVVMHLLCLILVPIVIP